jgi:hypothetical protein
MSLRARSTSSSSGSRRGTASDADRERLRHLQVVLDQCWDLLRQRRARREFGQNPDEARVRDEKTVEGYSG